MKKLAALLSAALILTAAIIPASAAGSEKWTKGNGYLIDGKNAEVVLKETDKGLQVTHGGYYTDGKNWGGVAYNEKVTLDGFSVELTIDKLPDTDSDTWFSVDFLQKPQLFQVGDYGSNKGIVNLIRWGNQDEVQNYGPSEWKGAGTDAKNDAFNLKAGDTLTVKVNKKDGKYVLTINGVESKVAYDLTGIADDGKAYLVISCSMKNSPADGFQYTITKINGKSVLEAKKPATTTAAQTSDAGVALAVLCVASLAGAVVVSKKLRRA